MTDEAQHRAQMARKKALQDARIAQATQEKGLIIVHTGPGKGKTTAALGMVFRALGHGMRIGIVQFTKGARESGEAAFARELAGRVDFFALGEGFTWETQDRERDRAAAERAWAKACALMEDPHYDLVVLDELNIVLRDDTLPLEPVMEKLRQKRPALHVVITGRSARPELVELADLVTEMKLVKHPFRSGIKAQRGIEF
ncbi:cob(I)yrinic acid a,c-diamide adenosyltransferase [Chloracidobacterium thermophilum]|uniref:corrinoid adenosyltransferase n=1 Tax=Chloracidobacterium thermophilum (strain B) TaxID=981222 RepID=G2LKJ9_CHLTF|nr:cob(I)yrinic acid a,c-diamide adenosyltransferase [Chloracidobacterium thermophilum]AEP13285.1 cob(I)yrinic acid a,c-diamide adenosyltransferase [Chloracidobacterium thermophilum B]QUV80566.1 cob(I)yrinic acid a,c-diamide adenosyltransferase [Chloracidobacterium thermophilum]